MHRRYQNEHAIINLCDSYRLDWLDEIDFNRTLMTGMLSFLLFAGALHVDLNGLVKAKMHVTLLAIYGLLCIMCNFLSAISARQGLFFSFQVANFKLHPIQIEYFTLCLNFDLSVAEVLL